VAELDAGAALACTLGSLPPQANKPTARTAETVFVIFPEWTGGSACPTCQPPQLSCHSIYVPERIRSIPDSWYFPAKTQVETFINEEIRSSLELNLCRMQAPAGASGMLDLP
jgi:hypothetical protein